MECICTGCGKLWKSEELAFDLTDRIKTEIEVWIHAFAEAGERSGLLGSNERLFNVWKQKPETRFLVSEKELYNLPEIETDTKAEGDKYVKYAEFYEELMRRLESREGEKNLGKWLRENQLLFGDDGIYLWLRKSGGGKIRISQIRDMKTRKALAEYRVCPVCGHKMSYWSGRYRELRLTVLGGPRVSKSTTLTACADAFLQKSQNIVWEAWEEDEEWEVFYENYLKLYREGKPLKATNPENEKIPEITFRVMVGEADSDDDENFVVLTFIDLPGEYIKGRMSDAIYEKYKPFYDHIDFVWYCTDPGEVRQIKGSAQDTTAIEELGYGGTQEIIPTREIIEHMTSLSSFFRRADRKVPVAYILGKTDAGAIDDEDKKQFSLYLPDKTESFNPLDVKEFWEHSWKVREYMELYNPALIRGFEQCFGERCYIAASAYGCDPRKKEEKRLRPYNRTLPFMWMMALCNCIPVFVKHKVRARVQEAVEILNDLPEDVRKKTVNNLYTRGFYKI